MSFVNTNYVGLDETRMTVRLLSLANVGTPYPEKASDIKLSMEKLLSKRIPF